MTIPDKLNKDEMNGYAIGQLERDALAISNSDLRSDLLKIKQQLAKISPKNIDPDLDLYYAYDAEKHHLWGPFQDDPQAALDGYDVISSEDLCSSFIENNHELGSFMEPILGRQVVVRFINITARDPHTWGKDVS